MDTAPLIAAYPPYFQRRVVLGGAFLIGAGLCALVALAAIAAIFMVGMSKAVLLCLVVIVFTIAAVSAFRLGRQHVSPQTCSPLLRDLRDLLPTLHAQSPDDLGGDPSEPLDELVGAYKIMDRAAHRERAQVIASQILTYLHHAGVDCSHAHHEAAADLVATDLTPQSV